MTQFKRTGGDGGGGTGGWQMLLIHVCHQISTTQSLWHLKVQNETDVRSPRQPFPQIWGNGAHRLRPPHVWNIQRGYRGWVIRWRETVAETGVCTYARECVCICVSTNVWLTGCCLVLIHIHSANLWQRPNSPAAHLFPSSTSKTTPPSL